MKPSIILLRNPLNPDEREQFPIEEGTQIIEWLVEHSPDGFGMPIRVFINQKEIQVQDLDRELKQDEICFILVSPATWPVWVVQYVIPALISLAVGIAVSLLFPPASPKNRNLDGSPIYDIGATRNSERLGAPIELIYGSNVLAVPSFASAPYTFYSKAGTYDMYLDSLFCVGLGEFEEIKLSDIVVGDTPADSMPPGTIYFKQFQQSGGVGNVLNHNGLYGNIQSQLWADPFGGTDEYNFIEHCYTAPEVTDWEFGDDINSATQIHSNIQMTFANSGTVSTVTVASSVPLRSGQKFSVVGTGTHDGDYFISYGIGTGAVNPNPDVDGDYNEITYTLNRQVPAATVTGSIQAEVKTSNAKAGPYVCSPVGKTIKNVWLDFLNPRGIYRARTSGRYEYPSQHPRMRITLTEIDNNNAIVAGGVVAQRIVEWSHNRPNPVRRTYNIGQAYVQAPHAPADFRGKRYQCEVEALMSMTDSQKIENATTWAALRSDIDHQGDEIYGKTTIVAVRMKATNGISSQASNQLKIWARRKYPLLDGTVGVFI